LEGIFMSRSVSIVAVGLFLSSAGGVAYGNWIENPANGHWYRLTSPGDWQFAEDVAVSWGGHLVTVNDEDENTWICATFGVPVDQHGPWFGYFQPPGSGEPSEDWSWISGETPGYEAWGGSEPNNLGAEEDWAEIRSPTCTWNDIGPGSAGYPAEGLPGLVEVAGPYPVPTVSEWGLVVLTLLAMTAGTILLSRRQRQIAA
jgi:hypothetical protein